MTIKPPRPRRLRRSLLRSLLKSEASGGLVLIGAAVLAMLVANGAWSGAYFAALAAHIGPLSALHWINDGLMALFFLLVGLEIKREAVEGELSTARRRTLPCIAAAGGMAVPALIYLAVQLLDNGAPRGWAVPAATDIAFTLALLALLGRRVPPSLKIFVTALAIIDDLGAVAIIALFYTDSLALGWLGAAAALLVALVALNRSGVTQLWPYLVLGALLWAATLSSGVHATLAGVALAATIPMRTGRATDDHDAAPLYRLEHALQPWTAYAIVPLFGFANAGIALGGIGWSDLARPVTLGVAAGLFLGKQLGVFGAVWAALRLKLGERPDGARLVQIYGVALLCGIGFTMSLFIGLLAFDNPVLQLQVKLGVLVGSLLSALAGVLVLRFAARRPRQGTRIVSTASGSVSG